MKSWSSANTQKSGVSVPSFGWCPKLGSFAHGDFCGLLEILPPSYPVEISLFQLTSSPSVPGSVWVLEGASVRVALRWVQPSQHFWPGGKSWQCGPLRH